MLGDTARRDWKKYAIPAPVEVRAEPHEGVGMHVTRMHDVEIDRYPTISTSACVRSGLTRRPRPPEPAASHAESARAAPLRSRTDRDPMPSGTLTPFPHTMRGRPDHRSASAVPVLTVGAGGRNV